MTEETHHEHAEHHEHHEHSEHHEHHEHNAEHKGIGIKKVHIWQIATALAVILLVISIFTGGFIGKKGSASGTVSAEDAAEKAMEYINTNLVQQGTPATLNSVKEDKGIYVINITVQGRDYASFVTKDAELLFVGGYDMTQKIEPVEKPTEEQPAATMAKSDKPVIELFVMSHCPYGTQAEKGIIPAVKALGDKIDFKIRFVYYAMHGEKEVKEELQQYCIREEQNAKYLDYLECFLTEGDGTGCIDAVKIDKAKLDACTKKADAKFNVTANFNDQSTWLSGRYPKINFDLEANTKYSVGGSPTLVINGAEVSSARDPASMLKTICGAFNTAPEACNTQLSSAQPSAGFGYTTTTGSTTTAQCG
jgi:hypothetical protein